MLIGFLDDTEIIIDDSDKQPDIFGFGGYFIRLDQLAELQKRIGVIKAKYDLPYHAPVKWNLRDKSLKEFYNSNNGLDPSCIQRLLQISNPLRRDLLSLLAELDAKVFLSARYDIANRPTSRDEYYSWAFENLLQRVGLMVRNLQPSQQVDGSYLVVDWPQRGAGKLLFENYFGGHHFGKGLATNQTYYSGPLKDIGFADSIFHSSTLHNGPLQMADLVTGCCRAFLSWAFKGTGLQKFEGTFDLLIPLFYRDNRGNLSNCGFKVAKAGQLDVETKIQDYLNLVSSKPT